MHVTPDTSCDSIAAARYCSSLCEMKAHRDCPADVDKKVLLAGVVAMLHVMSFGQGRVLVHSHHMSVTSFGFVGSGVIPVCKSFATHLHVQNTTPHTRPNRAPSNQGLIFHRKFAAIMSVNLLKRSGKCRLE